LTTGEIDMTTATAPKPTAPLDLTGQRCLVVGGTSGIGAATAALFGARGADVIVCGRDSEKAERAAGRVGATAVRADAASTADLDALFARAGTIDHLVVAASGASGGGPFAELDLGILHDAFEAKFWAHLKTLQAALGHVRASMTLITAGSSRAAIPGTAGLAAINGALDAIVPPLSAELAPLRVNAVSPGVIRTPWWDGLPESERDGVFQAFAAAAPAGRIGEPEDVAHAVLLMATNPYITGTVLDVAGGLQLPTGP
jgi:NAD(P)-dependent dehydrogenase (short-subunit alcohol dehydrogenase family)